MKKYLKPIALAAVMALAINVAYAYWSPYRYSFSAHVLDKFIYLDDAIVCSHAVVNTDISDAIEGIKERTVKGGDQPSDTVTVARALKVRKLAEVTRDKISGIRDQVIATVGGYNNEGILNRPYTCAAQMKITLAEEDGSYVLETMLQDFESGIKQLTNNAISFASLTPEGEMLVPGDAAFRGMSFAEAHFKDMPNTVALANLSRIEREVVRIEYMAIDFLWLKTKEPLEFKTINQVCVWTDAQFVRNSFQYRADVLVAEMISNIPFVASINGQELESEGNPHQVSFSISDKPTHNEYNEFGLVERFFNAKLAFSYAWNRDTTLVSQERYFIRKSTKPSLNQIDHE